MGKDLLNGDFSTRSFFRAMWKKGYAKAFIIMILFTGFFAYSQFDMLSMEDGSETVYYSFIIVMFIVKGLLIKVSFKHWDDLKKGIIRE